MTRNVVITTDQHFSSLTADAFIRLCARKLQVSEHRISGYRLVKSSVDARRGRLKVHHACTVFIDEAPMPASTSLPVWKQLDPDRCRQAVVVGSGPAGLFAALRLIEEGIRPIVVERGPETALRRRDIARISREHRIDPDSNYCCGEGGAGTFSDGKLFTRSNKRGDIGRILAILHHHGADASILTDAHPHIGTDRLGSVITAIRRNIESFGGKVIFAARATDFMITSERGTDTSSSPGMSRAAGIVTADGVRISGDGVILAAGHSARDILAAAALRGARLEAKPFAMGVRVEHPRALIDRIQYHGLDPGDLGAASYRLAAQVEGRGIYSFCMCPGGLVVPSATAENQIVVNGMSPSNRGTRWSNAAIVVEVRPEDIPAEFVEQPPPSQDFPPEAWQAMAGMRYQEQLEQRAGGEGRGQAAPAQRLTDFLAGRASRSLPAASYTPGVVPSRLDLWLPPGIVLRLKEAFRLFNRSMAGFICDEALLLAVESRTSSPVRMVRSAETMEAIGLPGLYPAGEGSGWAGGIVSSAMDGEAAATALAARLKSG